MSSNFAAVLQIFEGEGFREDSHMRHADLLAIVDKCSGAGGNGKGEIFDRQIFTELWDNTLKTEVGDCVLLKDYIETVCEAVEILEGKVGRAQDKYSGEVNQNKKRELLQMVYSLEQDIKAITRTFRLEHPEELNSIKIGKSSINENDRTFNSIFTGEIQLSHGLSRGLTLVAYLSFFSLLLSLTSASGKAQFFGLLVTLFTSCIFLLNYFDRTYIQFVFFNLILSVVADSLWLAMNLKDYWESVHPMWKRYPNPYSKFVDVAVIICFVAKAIIAVILFNYRGNPHGLRKKAHFFMLEFNLQANPVQNPFSKPIFKSFPRFMIG